MPWFISQTLLLMLLAFFLGAALACLLRRLGGSVRERVVSTPATAGVAAAPPQPPRTVDPLPNVPPRPPQVQQTPSAQPPTNATTVNKLERALAGSPQPTPRPAPQPATPPPIRPVAPPAAAGPATSKPNNSDLPLPPRPVAPAPAPAPRQDSSPQPPPVSAGPAPQPVKPAAPIAPAAATIVAAAAQAAAPVIKNLTPVAASTPTVTAGANAASTVVSSTQAGDDLLNIRGVDAGIATILNKAGITTYRQIAKWVKGDIAQATQAFGLVGGRIEQENWIEQAQILASGNDTAYSRQRRLGASGHGGGAGAKSAAGLGSGMAGAAGAAAAAGMLRQAAGAPAATGGPHVEERAAFAARPTTAASGAGTAPPMAAPARDSLQRISGISEELERLLNGHGVTRYVHIAGWSRDDIQRFDRLLGSDGRITRENWIEQAQLLATGGATAYAKSFDDRLRGGDRQQTPSSRIDLAALPSIKSEAYRPRVDATAASAAVTAATNSGYRPPRSTDVDDLKRIRGVGVLIEKKLNSIGVVSYEQVAQWTKEDIDRISHMLDFVGRIERENWVEQARILAAGGATEFSRRVDLGEVETSKKG